MRGWVGACVGGCVRVTKGSATKLQLCDTHRKSWGEYVISLQLY